jgi:hypothetical protein
MGKGDKAKQYQGDTKTTGHLALDKCTEQIDLVRAWWSITLTHGSDPDLFGS